MKQTSATKQGALKYLFMLFVQRGIGITLFILAAGTIVNIRGLVYTTLYLLISVIACVLMYKGHQETMSERGKTQDNTKGWDKVLLPIYVLLAYYGIFLVAGLGIRYQWEHLSLSWFFVGIVLYIISGTFTVWPVLENTHFESTSRIQSNRKQQVISTGPYRIVHHPGYMGILIWAVSTALIFGTWQVSLTSAIIIVVIWIRTYLEDSMLKKELDGYAAYADQVKYRLIPFVW